MSNAQKNCNSQFLGHHLLLVYIVNKAVEFDLHLFKDGHIVFVVFLAAKLTKQKNR